MNILMIHCIYDSLDLRTSPYIEAIRTRAFCSCIQWQNRNFNRKKLRNNLIYWYSYRWIYATDIDYRLFVNTIRDINYW